MKKVSKVVSYLGAFTLGLYVSSQFVFNNPVESHKWLITSLMFVFMIALSEEKN